MTHFPKKKCCLINKHNYLTSVKNNIISGAPLYEGCANLYVSERSIEILGERNLGMNT